MGDNSTTLPSTTTTAQPSATSLLNATTTVVQNVTTTLLSSTTSSPPTTTSTSTMSTTSVPTSTSTTASTSTFFTTTLLPDPQGSPGMVFFSCVIFLVAVALVVKIVISNRKKRSDLIGGSARWRLAASQQSGAGPARTAASYAPMNSRDRPAAGGLDSAGPDRNLDWERQFFDDTEPTLPSRLQLDFNRAY